MSGHVFKIGFKELPSPIGFPNGDSAFVGWNMVDSTTGDTLLTDQPNRAPNDDYRVVRGMRVKVVGFHRPVPGLAEGAFLCMPDALWPLQGNSGLQGPAFGGGLILAMDDSRILHSGLDPATDPDSFSTIEIRFSRTLKQKAYRYLLRRLPNDDVPSAGSGYRYGGFFEVPFTVWDTDHNIQLDCAFVEKVFTDDDGTYLPRAQQPATFDSAWAPNTSEDGNRELLFLLRSGYTDAEKSTLAVDNAVRNGALPSLYELWARKASVDARVNAGDVFRILWNAVPAGPNDVYVFGSSPVVHNNAPLARSHLGMVRVVPNPYYTRSRYDVNQFNRVMRFINLPETCTIRIYNLAGELVRTLQKSDATNSTLNWDLLTENRLPVASGVYVYHVEAPGVGSAVGRMVIFMEKERLNSL